jgi:predicted  nucleic acid-binding Zn-ribbon protein
MGREMSNEANSEPAAQSAPSKAGGQSENQLGFTGENILTLLRRSAELADGNSRYAVEIAQKMSDQLWIAQKKVAELQVQVTELEAQIKAYPDRIAELEAEVQLYRNKSERAELWLSKISSEIQERVLGSNN